MEIAKHSTDWLTVVLLGYALIFGLLHYFKPKYFNAFLRLPVSNAYFTVLQQQKGEMRWFVFAIEFLWIIALGVFTQHVYQSLNSTDGSQLALFSKISLIALLIITIQRFFHSLTGVLFDMKDPFSRFIEIKDGHLQWASVMLVIFVAIKVYSPIQSNLVIYLGFALLAIAYIFGVVKAALVTTNKNLSGLQLFLYLCTLEILPVLVVVKMAIK